jgi:multisubunit Na+/H+ antiporter MnhF subunit
MDVTSQVIDAINAWLQSLSEHLLRPALAAAGQLLFQTPTFDSIPEVSRTWAVVRDLTDGLFVIALLAAGVMVMASGTFESRYSVKALIPRIVLAAIAANASLALCGALIKLDNALVTGVVGPDPGTTTFDQLASMVQGPHISDQVVGSLVGLGAAVLAILLVGLYVGRDIVLVVATVLSPLALATYALPQTDEIARIWWRVFSALLFVQVIEAILVELGLELLRHTDWLGGPTSDLVSGLVLITLLFLLFKIPFAAYHWAFRHPLSQSPVVQTAVATAKVVAAAVA